QLAEHTLGGHLALEVLDRALDALVADGDFEGLADDGVARVDGGAGRRSGDGRHDGRGGIGGRHGDVPLLLPGSLASRTLALAVTGVAMEGAGGSELTELVTDH